MRLARIGVENGHGTGWPPSPRSSCSCPSTRAQKSMPCSSRWNPRWARRAAALARRRDRRRASHAQPLVYSAQGLRADPDEDLGIHREGPPHRSRPPRSFRTRAHPGERRASTASMDAAARCPPTSASSYSPTPAAARRKTAAKPRSTCRPSSTPSTRPRARCARSSASAIPSAGCNGTASRCSWRRPSTSNPDVAQRARAAPRSRHAAPRHREGGRASRAARRDAPERPARSRRVRDLRSRRAAGSEIRQRAPRTERLRAGAPLQRKVVEARRRRLGVSRTRVIRMLTGSPDGPGAARERGCSAPASSKNTISRPGAAPRRAQRRRPGLWRQHQLDRLRRDPHADAERFRRVMAARARALGPDARHGLARRAPECDRPGGRPRSRRKAARAPEWIPVSSGARIAMDSGTENLDATARVVRRIVEFTPRRAA